MSRHAVLLLAALVGTQATPPRAAGFDFGLGLFKKKPKAEPPTRVKQLVATLQSDPDEKARLAAAEELRSFDPRSNPEMVAALIGSLQRDPSAAVRAEAAGTLGRLKPVDQATGLALEAVQEADPAATVREAAKAALWQYHLNGYKSATTIADGRPQTAEPPLATRRSAIPSASKPVGGSVEVGFRPITNGVGKATTYQPTGEPPLAKGKSGAKAVAEQTPAPPKPVVSAPTPAPLPSLAPIPTPAPNPSSFPMAMPTAPEIPSPVPTVGTPNFSYPSVPSYTPPPSVPNFPALPSVPH